MPLRQTLIQCLAAGAGTLVLVLSWLPDSRMERLPLMPGWLGAWLDRGGLVATFRTGLAMAVASALIHVAGAPRDARRSVVMAAALLLAAEGGQLILSSRQASLGDVGWGLVGVAVGVACAHGLTGSSRRLGGAPSEEAAPQKTGGD